MRFNDKPSRQPTKRPTPIFDAVYDLLLNAGYDCLTAIIETNLFMRECKSRQRGIYTYHVRLENGRLSRGITIKVND